MSARPDRDAFITASKEMARARAAALDTLTSYKVNDVHVFDTTASDLNRAAAEQAHAVCIVLGNAINEGTDIESEIMSLRPMHIARALDAIETLIAFSLFASEGKLAA